MTAHTLRFLADESCDFAVVRALRKQGHNVVAVSEYAQRSIDAELLTKATQEQRILLTEDKDFGWLVFASNTESPGVVLIRFPGHARSGLVAAMTRVVDQYGQELMGCFTVLQPGIIRIAPKPRSTADS